MLIQKSIKQTKVTANADSGLRALLIQKSIKLSPNLIILEITFESFVNSEEYQTMRMWIGNEL